jgi:hypothetical protein
VVAQPIHPPTKQITNSRAIIDFLSKICGFIIFLPSVGSYKIFTIEKEEKQEETKKARMNGP